MKELERRLQCGGMNAGKLLCAGALLVSAGCVTDPGDLGAVSGTSGGGTGGEASESGDAPTSETATTSATSVDPEGSSSSGEGEESSTGEPVDPACELDVGEGLARAMTGRQFEHAVEDLFGVEVDVEFQGTAPFDAHDTVGPVAQMEIDAAAQVAAAAFEVPPCGGDPSDCGQSFIDEYAPVVLRGQADHDALLATYESAASYDEGIRAVVETMISDPAFADVSPTGEMNGEFLELDGASVATRLALLMWNSVPDAQLLAAADSLLEEGGIEAELPRMFDDPRYTRAQGDLYMLLTDVEALLELERDNVDASWSETTAPSMLEEQRRFIGDLSSNSDSTLGDLLTSSSTYVNAELAALYGDDLQTPVPGGNSWGPGELDPARRGGILTQLAFVARHSNNLPADGYQPPTHRGKGLNEAVSCFDIPPPPPDVAPELVDLIDRPTWEEQVEGAAKCAGCHAVTDPHGHAYGNYDGLGRWFESGNALDGTFPVLDIEFEDAVDLSAQLAEHEQVRTCVVTRHFQFALRRSDEARDACTIEQTTEAFNESGGNLRALVEATATAETFVLARP